MLLCPSTANDCITRAAISASISIANVRGLDTPFTVRILAHFDRKMNAVLIDAEIVGERTIISSRVGARIHTVVATTSGGAKITRMEGYIV